VEDEMREMERQTSEVKQAAKEAVSLNDSPTIHPPSEPAAPGAPPDEAAAHGQTKPA